MQGFKVAGAYVGDDEWCSAKLLALLAKRLANLDLVDRIRDSEKVRNATQLKCSLLRLVASSIPNHWMRIMLPHVTRAAAEMVDARIADSFLALAVATDSPEVRIDLAVLCARVPIKLGGCGIASYVSVAAAAHVASVAASRAAVAAAYPPFAALDLASADGHPVAAAFGAAYEAVRSTLGVVHARFAAIDDHIYVDINGTRHAAFRPALPKPLLKPMPALPDLVRDTDSKTPPFLRQKALSMVAYCSEWLSWLDEARTFDAANTDAVTKEREARRVISISQFGSGGWLQITNDTNIRHSKVPSAEMRAAVQYRTGLYASALTGALDERERRGIAVTQADRLGDTAVNTVGTTTRHNRFNRYAFEAVAAVATGAVLLGDKGDGLPRARAEAVRRNAHYATQTTALTSSSRTLPTASTSRASTHPSAPAPAPLGSARAAVAASRRAAPATRTPSAARARTAAARRWAALSEAWRRTAPLTT